MVMFLVLNGAAIFAALRAALALGAGERMSGLVLCTLSGYLIVIHSVVLAAGLLGWLTVGGVAVLTAIALAVALGLRPIRRHRGDASRIAEPVTPAALFVPLLALVVGLVWARPHLFDATRLWIWDDYTYHMVYPALWLRQHAIAAVTPAEAFTMQAWYPLSASVVATWFMVPFHGDRGDSLAWVSLTAPLYAGIIASATAELLARVGCRRGAWALSVVLFATSERMAVMAASFSDADLAQAAVLAGGFAFAIPRSGRERRADLLVDAGYAALLTGLAIAMKATTAPYAAVVLALAAARAYSLAPQGRLVAAVVLAFGASWLAIGAYWYARNLFYTGDPLYPAAFLGWPGTTFPQTTLREYAQHYGLARAMKDALAVYTNWPLLHAVLAAAGLVGVAGWLLAHRSGVARPAAYFAAGTVAIAALMLSLLPVAPYSAGNAMTFVSGFVHWDSMRYVALLPVLGWAGLGFLVDAGAGARAPRTLAAVALATGALLASPTARAASLVLLAAVALAAVLAARMPPHLRSGLLGDRARGAVLAAAVVTMATIVVVTHGTKAAATAALLYREPLFGAAAAVLDAQPAGTRVAIFGDQWVYPAFGACDQLVPVRLDGDGRVAASLVGDAMEPGPLTVSLSTFRANLRRADVNVVVIVHLPHPGRSAEWPSQHVALEALRDARLLHRDGAVGIWMLASDGDRRGERVAGGDGASSSSTTRVR